MLDPLLFEVFFIYTYGCLIGTYFTILILYSHNFKYLLLPIIIIIEKKINTLKSKKEFNICDL